MSYRVDVDFCPAYELLMSLLAYIGSPGPRALDLGNAWKLEVKKRLTPALSSDLAGLRGEPLAVPPLSFVLKCPGPRDAEGFLNWYGSMPEDELYERCIALPGRRFRRTPKELSAIRDRGVRVLEAWNEQYFRHFDPAILSGLADDAAAKRALVGKRDPAELVEWATSGVWYDPSPEIARVVLVPQHHFIPWNMTDTLPGTVLNLYPADIAPVAPGQLPPALRRLTGALADESRLRILRFLGEGPRSFTEVVKFTGLAKSTVHHHMVALRASGLVRVHASFATADRYSLRPDAFESLGRRLMEYLRGV